MMQAGLTALVVASALPSTLLPAGWPRRTLHAAGAGATSSAIDKCAPPASAVAAAATTAAALEMRRAWRRAAGCWCDGGGGGGGGSWRRLQWLGRLYSDVPLLLERKPFAAKRLMAALASCPSGSQAATVRHPVAAAAALYGYSLSLNTACGLNQRPHQPAWAVHGTGL